MSWLLKVAHLWVTFFNNKGRLLYSFYLCHILPGIATLVILGRIIDGEKLCWQGPYNEHVESWGHMMNYG
jgi:hypothetical protein